MVAGSLRFHLINHALLGINQRSQFRQQHASDRGQVALALQHSGEARKVRFEPVLLVVAIGGEPQVVDHRVDVVFQLRDLTAGFDLDRTSQVALGNGRSDLRNGAHLIGQVVGK